MSVHVLFNSLNKLRKRDKMRRAPHLSLFCNVSLFYPFFISLFATRFINLIIQEHE